MRVHREFCADARSHASGLLVEALFKLAMIPRGVSRHTCAGDVWGERDYITAAHGALSGRPGLQFTLDSVCVLPANRLADLLASPGGHTVERLPDGKARVNVAGMDIVPYDPGLLGPAAMRHCEQLVAGGARPQTAFPAFVVPRSGSMGLALSDIAVRADQQAGRPGFDGGYLVGAGVLRPEGIVEMLPAVHLGA